VPGIAAPADRRFRRSAGRPERRRLGRKLVRAARWIVPAAVLCLAGAWLAGAVLQARILAVQRVVITGTDRLTSDEVQGLLEGMRGENILQVDFERYRNRVLESPWIADVTLWRMLPSTIEVRIIERTPMAIARLNQQLFLVDGAGVLIDEYGPQYADIDLPIVDGLVSAPGEAGPLVDTGRVSLTAAFLAAMESRPDLGRRLSQVDVSNPRDVAVMFDHDPVWLHLGEEQFVERLTTYLELVPTLQERFVDIDYVDLRYGERVFVRSQGRVDERVPRVNGALRAADGLDGRSPAAQP
jgi:cell division septal protein FtsQ